MEKLTATEIIYLMDKIEIIESVRMYNKNTNDCIDRIFYKAFGLDWYKTDCYKELRKMILSIMDLVESKYTKDHFYLIGK